MTENETKQAKNRAVLVGLNAHCLSAEENADDTSMEELADLLETAGGVCGGTVFQNKDAPDPRTFIGEGKAAEVKELVGAMGADMVVVDNPLSPSQQRVLSEELGVQVLDRAALILDIFAQRARTREGRLQVELAQYQYLLPRLLGMWTHLERQEGAIGTRGPGETQLESDRRHIRRKISKLEEELKDVRRVRATQRERRIKNEVPVVAIVGYTNAGKSTLLNRLVPNVSIPKLMHCGCSSERSISAARTSLPIRRSRLWSVSTSYNGSLARNARAIVPCCFCRTVLSTNNGPNPYRRRCGTLSFTTGHPCRSRSHAQPAMRRSS